MDILSEKLSYVHWSLQAIPCKNGSVDIDPLHINFVKNRIFSTRSLSFLCFGVIKFTDGLSWTALYISSDFLLSKHLRPSAKTKKLACLGMERLMAEWNDSKGEVVRLVKLATESDFFLSYDEMIVGWMDRVILVCDCVDYSIKIIIRTYHFQPKTFEIFEKRRELFLKPNVSRLLLNQLKTLNKFVGWQ